MTTAREARTRYIRAIAALGLAVVLAGCTAGSPDRPSTATQGIQMTDSATTTGSDLVQWDLSSPRTPRELGGRSADVVSAETLGRDGVDVRIVLPGGDTVSGAFGLVTGDTGGGGGAVRYLSLATTQLHDGAWDAVIDDFVAQFGGDRAAITDYLDSALPAMAAGQVDPGRHFPGDARSGYQPSLQLRPDADGVVVAWKFTLTSG